MQYFNKLGLAAVAAASLMAASQAHAANLISDGTFSTPNTGGGWGFFTNGQVGGWMDDSDYLEVGNNGIYGLGCYSGSICQNLEVNANGFDTVYQTVTGLTVGKTYTLSYAYGGRPGGGPQALDVSFGGQLLTVDTGSLGAWTNETFHVTATSSAESLVFASQNVGGLPSYGNEITNVSLSVPEPASWALMIVGLGGLGVALRRRAVAAVA